MKRILTLISISLLAINAFANIKLPAIFSDGVVLQQKSNVAIWGWAEPGEKISITNSWSGKTISLQADATGKWKGELPTPKAGGPYTITFSGTNRIELKDILIGEVWLCSGQSNMVFSLKGSYQAKEEIAKADFPTIRYFSVERQYGLQDFNDCAGSVWKKTSPNTAGSFSAVAYYFAKKIQQELNVPVGIVYAAWGGTPAEAWTPADVMKKDKVLSAYFDRWKAIQDNVGKDSTQWHQDLRDWKEDSVGKKKPAEPQTLYYYKRPWREPSVLFNGMIGPVIPFTIKGFLWYQGESNVSYADEYYQLFSSMIQSWRAQWKKKALPFYFVQLASYGYDRMEAAALLREAQSEVAKKIPNTGMAVTLDVGNMDDIHFTHKKEVGDRLAFIALKQNYSKDLDFKGPLVEKVFKDGDSVIVKYKDAIALNAGKGKEPKGFELGYKVPGTDSISWTKARAEERERGKGKRKSLVIWSERKEKPVAVRYGWLFPGEANIMNEEGLPAAPFRDTNIE